MASSFPAVQIPGATCSPSQTGKPKWLRHGLVFHVLFVVQLLPRVTSTNTPEGSMRRPRRDTPIRMADVFGALLRYVNTSKSYILA